MNRICGFFVVSIFLVVFGCRMSEKQNVSGLIRLSVNPESVQDKISMSEITKSVKYVSLATSNDLLINDLVKVVHAENIIYVADRMALYKFDEEGLLLNKISKSGSGPGEYVNITDFILIPDGSVWVLCRSSKRLIKYGWDGTVKEKIELNNWVSNIYKIDNDRLCLYIGNEIDGDNQSKLKVLNLETKKIESESLAIDPKRAKYLHVKSINHFAPSTVAGDIYFFEMFNDTIYKLVDNQSFPAYCVSISDKNIPSSFFDTEYKDVMEFFQALFKNNYAYGTNIFMEAVSQYLFSYYYKGECYMTIIPKESNLSSIDFKIIEEDVNFYKYPINLTDLKLFVQENNELILTLMPSDIITYAEKYLEKEKVDELKNKLKYTDEDQNPILILMQM